MFTRFYEATGKVINASGKDVSGFEIEFYIRSFLKPSRLVIRHFAEEQAEEMLRPKIGKRDEIVVHDFKRIE